MTPAQQALRLRMEASVAFEEAKRLLRKAHELEAQMPAWRLGPWQTWEPNEVERLTDLSDEVDRLEQEFMHAVGTVNSGERKTALPSPQTIGEQQ